MRSLFKNILFIYFFREKEIEWERKRNINVWEKHSLGDPAHNPGMCPDWESNRWPLSSQGSLNPLSHTPARAEWVLLFVTAEERHWRMPQWLFSASNQMRCHFLYSSRHTGPSWSARRVGSVALIHTIRSDWCTLVRSTDVLLQWLGWAGLCPKHRVSSPLAVPSIWASSIQGEPWCGCVHF